MSQESNQVILDTEQSSVLEGKSLKEFVEAIPTVLYIYNVSNGRNELLTPHTASSLGYSFSEFEEFNENFIEHFMHPEDLESLSQHFDKLKTLKENEHLENEYRMRHKSGKWIWFRSCDCVLSRAPSGLPERILGVAYNINVQKQTFTRSLIQYKIARILTETKTINEAVPQILETICLELDYKIGELWCMDKSEEFLHLENVWHIPSKKLEELIAKSSPLKLAKGSGLPGKVWSNGAPVWIENIKTDSDTPRKTFFEERNLQSAVAFPILLGEKLLGVFSFFSSEMRETDETLMQMFAAAGSNIGQFIKRQKTEEELRTAERRATDDYLKLLSRIVPLAQVLGTSPDLLSIYREIVAFIRASMPCVGFFVSFFDSKTNQRIAAYGWGEEGDVDISELPPMPVTQDGGPNSVAILTGKTQILDRYMEFMKNRPHVILQENGIDPQSSLVVPMVVMGRVIGTLEVQAYDRNSFSQEHVVALEIMANLAAVAIENVRLLAAEAQARQAAEIANRTKDEFIAIVSHELRSPLNAMLGWARILQNPNIENVKIEQGLETIVRNARTQSKLIEDLLDTARISSGKLKLEAQPMDLLKIIKSVLEIAAPTADAKEITIQHNLASDIGLINGDAERIQQILRNLLSNAVKFTPKGGLIEVSLKRENSTALLCVKDTGNGISPELLPRIFEQFFQSDPASSRRHGGLGIGLSLTRKLVEMHGGSIKAESDGIGMGASFTVTLPLR